MEKKVTKSADGVNINFFGSVAKQNIVTMVQNCSSGACECMSDATKAKIKDMKVEGSDGDVALRLSGDISVEEIQEALNRSKVLNKKVLVMCTGNSCRSIIAEALINKELDGAVAQSCGVAPSQKVHPNAKRVLQENNAWDDVYHSKHLDNVIEEDFDLVVTVCSHADETCPTFPKSVKRVHIGFEDPDGKEYDAFIKTFDAIRTELLPKIKAYLAEL
jgi:arsenate reductase